MKNLSSWFDYYIHHVLFRARRNVSSAWRNWADLMTSNYSDYAFFVENEESVQEACSWCFWDTLNDPGIYSKHFMDYLEELASAPIETFVVVKMSDFDDEL